MKKIGGSQCSSVVEHLIDMQRTALGYSPNTDFFFLTSQSGGTEVCNLSILETERQASFCEFKANPVYRERQCQASQRPCLKKN